MKVTLRLRMSSHDAHYGGNLVDGARMLALFGDVATELLIRHDGDEGLFRAYDAVEFLAPVYAGDYIEAEGEIVKLGNTSRQMKFEARKVIRSLGGSSAEVLSEPIVVCKASGTCVTPKEKQREMTPMVITAAMVGAETTREQTPHLPISAEEIGEDAAKCREAGAAMVHIHVRKPDGSPSQDAELFRAAIREIRKRCDILVQVSTGGAVGMGVDERCGGLTLTGPDRPDMASLTTGTVNFGADVFWNPRPLVRDIATRIKQLGIKPEIECFDAGMIDEARALEKEGFIGLPAHFDFVLGVGGALGATVEALDFMRSYVPPGSTWTCAAMGRHQLTFVEHSAERGGNARVGLEDNIYLSKGVLAKGNWELVAEAAKRAKAKGRELATPQQARELLRLT